MYYVFNRVTQARAVILIHLYDLHIHQKASRALPHSAFLHPDCPTLPDSQWLFHSATFKQHCRQRPTNNPSKTDLWQAERKGANRGATPGTRRVYLDIRVCLSAQYNKSIMRNWEEKKIVEVHDEEWTQCTTLKGFWIWRTQGVNNVVQLPKIDLQSHLYYTFVKTAGWWVNLLLRRKHRDS